MLIGEYQCHFNNVGQLTNRIISIYQRYLLPFVENKNKNETCVNCHMNMTQ